MALRDVIGQIFRRRNTSTTTTNLPAGAGISGGDQYAMTLAARFQGETERRAIIQQCKLMYKTDPRVEKMHRTLARDLVRGGFAVRCNDPAARQVAVDLQKRLDLNQKCEDWTRLTSRDGDSFLEIGVDESMNISEVTRKPVLIMHRNSNQADRFENPARAFWMDADNGLYPNGEPGTDAIWFSEWQIIHARWNHDEESKYGTPMMSAATAAFKRVQEGEKDVAVRRKTRAGIRYHHVVEGGQADLEAYKESNKAALREPLAAVSDFFTNKPGSINVIEGDNHLGEITDIMHHIETMGTASDVPLQLIAYGNDINRDTLAEKKQEYEESLDQGREWLTTQIVKPLLERQWLLQGILPESLEYSIVWRPRIQMTPVLIRDLADALLKMKLLGVSADEISAILGYFMPGVDVSSDAISSMDANNSERFAGMLKGLSI